MGFMQLTGHLYLESFEALARYPYRKDLPGRGKQEKENFHVKSWNRIGIVYYLLLHNL